MSILEDRLDGSSIDVLNHKCSQIKQRNGFLVIPEKYHELFLEFLEDDEDINQLPANQETWTRIQAIYVRSFWLDTWYDDSLPTPHTTFESWKNVQKMSNSFDEDIKWASFSQVPFIRLTSLSSKTEQPYLSLREAVDDIQKSERCQFSFELGEKIKRQATIVDSCDDDENSENIIDDDDDDDNDNDNDNKDDEEEEEDRLPQVAFRKWIDLSKGKQYRCVVFEGQLVKIIPNDYSRVGTLSESKLLNRCQSLVDKMKYSWPCVDNIMDVWIFDGDDDIDNNSGSSSSSSKDIVIEFNSFGTIGNSHADSIDWRDINLYLFESPCSITV